MRRNEPDLNLGSQGDPWDAQWDMLLGLVGGALGLALLGRAHERAMAHLLIVIARPSASA